VTDLPLLPLPWVGPRHRVDSGPGGAPLRIVRLADGAVIGKLTLEQAGQGIFVQSLEIDPEHRGYGAGSEAAWLLQGAAVAGGAQMLRAWAAPNLGLSVYFWTRMGLHPLFGEGPEGGIWYERQLGQLQRGASPADVPFDSIR
jgi:hypothetical protein